MKTTSVPGVAARCAKSRSSPEAEWPDTSVTCAETPRCVTGMPADAGTADSAETPGTTSNGHAGLGERERLLAAAAEDERVAALEAHDLEPLPAELDEQRVQLGLLHVLARDHSASSGASATSSGATSTS